LQKDLDVAKSELKKKTTALTTLDKDYYTLKSLYRDAEQKANEASTTAITKNRQLQNLTEELSESRRATGALESEREEFRIKLERALAENRKLTGGAADDHEVDELEDAERQRLRERVRVLEEQQHQHQQHQTRQKRGMSTVSDATSLLPDDDEDQDFGELMKQEMEKQKKKEQDRLEKVREVKRGLEKWKGWRMDLTIVGGAAKGLGEMFEV